jgi:hypothetical protein
MRGTPRIAHSPNFRATDSGSPSSGLGPAESAEGVHLSSDDACLPDLALGTSSRLPGTSTRM